MSAESPSAGGQQGLGSLQSVNLDSKIRSTFVPDYGVRAVTEVFYLKVKRSLYLAAKRASLMELSRKEESNAGDAFDEEVEKVKPLAYVQKFISILALYSFTAVNEINF